MEPEPEDEEQAAAAAAAEAPDESAVLAARVQIAGHEVAADTTALDASEWGLTAAQVREVAGALPQLLCLQELVLDGVPVSGSTPRYGDFQYGVETVDADLGTFRALCAALWTCQALTSLSLGGCYVGPKALALLAEVVFRDARAVLAAVNVIGNAIGEPGARSLIEVFDANPRLQSLLGVKPGSTSADFSKTNMQPHDCIILAHELNASRAAAAVARLILDGNPLTGGNDSDDFDKDLSGVTVLFDTLKTSSVTELGLAKCTLGPGSLGKLGEYVREARAVLTSLNCSGNAIGEPGAQTLIKAIESSETLQFVVVGHPLPLKEAYASDSLDVSGKGLTPGDAIILAWWMKTSFSAVLASLNVSDNDGITGKRINDEHTAYVYGKQLEGWKTLCSAIGTAPSITEFDCSKCALTPPALAPLTEAIKVNAVAIKSLALSGNYIIGLDKYGRGTEDLSGFEQLCAAICKLHELNLSNCNLNPAAITIFATKVTWAEAVLEAVNLDDNYIDASGFKTVVEGAVSVKHLSVSGNPICCTGISTERPSTGDSIVVLASMVVVQVETDDKSSTPLKDNNGVWRKETDVLKCSSTAGEIWDSACSALAGTSLESLGLSKCGLNPESLAPLAKAISSMAVLKKVVLSQNFVFGLKMERRRAVHDVDADQTGWSALCDVLPAAPLEELIVADVGMGVTGVTSLAKAISAGAVLEEVNLAFNKIGAEGGAALVQAFKTSNIKFLGIGKQLKTAGGSCITRSLVKTGVTLSSAGRVGEVTEFHDRQDGYIKLKWQDDGSESNWTYINTLDGEPLSLPLQSAFEGELLDVSHQQLDPGYAVILAWWLSTSFSAVIEKVKISGRDVTPEAGAQLLTAANETSRARLRAHQVLAFSEALHARLGSECLLQAVALDTDVWRRVAENVRERHGHELMCSQLAQAGQTWFEVTVEGLIAEDNMTLCTRE
eukprot:COSAG01_NODE_555_length_15533_cov_35.243310_7_plen_952_part_00